MDSMFIPGAYIKSDGSPTENYTEAIADQAKVDQEKYKWLEFYKIKFTVDSYMKLLKIGKQP